MTFVKLNNKQSTPSFNNLIDDFFTEMPSILRKEFVSPDLKQSIPVNIREKEKEYILELFAPGLDKEDFQISLDKNILTVSSEKKNETENKDEKEIIREYKYRSFKRSFTIDEKIDAEKIVAKFLNGVLTLNLPKKEAVKEATKQITIS